MLVHSFINKFDETDKYSSAKIVIEDLHHKYITGSDFMDDYIITHHHLLRECVKQERMVFAMQQNSPLLPFLINKFSDL